MLKEYKIDYVLTILYGTPITDLIKDYEDENIKHCYINAPDSKNYNLSLHFHEGITFIKEGIMDGKNVFVHCYHGISRSACIIIAYLIETYAYSYEYALELTQKCRGIVNPNIYFLLLLEDLSEKQRIENLSRK